MPRFSFALPSGRDAPIKRLLPFNSCFLVFAGAAMVVVDRDATGLLGAALLMVVALSSYLSSAPARTALTALPAALYVGLQVYRTILGENHLPEAFVGLLSFPVVSWLSRATWLSLARIEGELQERAKLAEELTMGARVAKATKHLNTDMLLEYELHRACRYNRPLSLLILEAVGMQRSIEEEGADAATQLLGKAEQVLVGLVRDADTISRRTATGFAVVLPETQIAGARSVAAKIFQRLAEQPGLDQMDVHIGIAQYPEDAGTTDELVAHAEAALEFAKAEALPVADRSLICQLP